MPRLLALIGLILPLFCLASQAEDCAKQASVSPAATIRINKINDEAIMCLSGPGSTQATYRLLAYLLLST